MYHISRLMSVQRKQTADVSKTFKHHILSCSKNTCLMFQFRVLNMIKTIWLFSLQGLAFRLSIIAFQFVLINVKKKIQVIFVTFCTIQWMHKTQVYLSVSLEINYTAY